MTRWLDSGVLQRGKHLKHAGRGGPRTLVENTKFEPALYKQCEKCPTWAALTTVRRAENKHFTFAHAAPSDHSFNIPLLLLFALSVLSSLLP